LIRVGEADIRLEPVARARNLGVSTTFCRGPFDQFSSYELAFAGGEFGSARNSSSVARIAPMNAIIAQNWTGSALIVAAISDAFVENKLVISLKTASSRRCTGSGLR
jgi:hypothetical protein